MKARSLTLSYNPRTFVFVCPHCGQNAPLVYRGVSAFCSACGKPRMPFTANAVNLRGKPAKFGGTVASIAGWVVLAGALAVALVLGSILQAIFPVGAVVGWVIGGLIATLGVAAALLLLFGGRALRRSGTHAAEAARLEALGSLAAHHSGVITSQSAAEALGVPVEEADRLLTSLAKQPESGITLEVDDDGKLTYRFARYAPQEPWPGLARVRLGTEVAENATGQAAPGRGATEIMPPAQPVGPQGTKKVPVRSPETPQAAIRVADVEVIPAEDEGAARRRGMRS